VADFSYVWFIFLAAGLVQHGVRPDEGEQRPNVSAQPDRDRRNLLYERPGIWNRHPMLRVGQPTLQVLPLAEVAAAVSLVGQLQQNTRGSFAGFVGA
jgi:hypothetical protein